jgi:hypothetical protein
MRKTLWITLAVLFVAIVTPTANADSHAQSLHYKFTYTATSGPIESFDFSLASSTFITSTSGSPPFTPFTITDGINSWRMTQDATGFSPPTTGDICFGTAGVLMTSTSCGASFHPPNGFLLITFIDGLPSSKGKFVSNFGGSFYVTVPGTGTFDGQNFINLGTGSLYLTIRGASHESVPEPPTIVLLGMAIGSVLALRKRIPLGQRLSSTTCHS